MSEEKRQNSRISMDVTVQFAKESVDANAKCDLKGVAQNSSLGGMFISTDDPLPPGSIIKLNFKISSENQKQSSIQARAIVKWAMSTAQPRGMGVEFIELEKIEETEFERWLLSLSDA